MIPTGNWEFGALLQQGDALGMMAERHLEGLPGEEQLRLRRATIHLFRHATPVFKELSSAPFSIEVPVEGEQEAAIARQGLTQYARQKDPPPCKIQLLVNYRTDPGDYRVGRTVDAVEMFQKDNPDVPVAYAAERVPNDETIGGLRAHLGNLSVIQMAGSKLHDALRINHDIDTIGMDPYYLRRMWDAFIKPGRLATGLHSQVRHARTYGKDGRLLFPNMDTVNAWFDYTAYAGGGYYDLANATSLRAYIAAGGYDARMTAAETFDLLQRIHQGKVRRHQGMHHVPASYLYTSPRRLYYQQYQNIGMHQIWQPGDLIDSPYREWNYAMSKADISEATRDYSIRQLVFRLPARIAMRYMHAKPGLSRGEALVKAHATLETARAVLGGPHNLFVS